MSTFSARGRSRLGLWVLTATHVASDFYAGAVAALLPYFVIQAQYSYAAVAGITLAATAFSSVAQPMFGYLSDRYGLRWMSLAGLLAAGVGIALSGIVADSYLAVWIVVAISGIGVAAYHPAATMEARELGGGTSASMSLFSVGGNLGVALAPTAVIFVVGTFGLAGSGLLIIPAVVMGLVYVVVSWRHSFASTVSVERVTAAAKSAIPDDWRAFIWLTVVLATWSVAYVGTSTFISLYSIQRFDVSTGVASIALSVFPAAGAVGTFAGGWLADRFGRLRIVRTGYLLAVASTIAIVLAPSPVAIIICTAILGASLFLPFAVQLTLSHSYLPNRIGVASGVTLGLTLSFGGLISPMLGSIADQTSVRAVFMVIAALLAAGFALSFVLRERTQNLTNLGKPPRRAV
ncbi:MAG: MFS transporter [Leucobacter sp.]|nr:MFS transporter [Leucobacter sp.]